MLCETDVAHLYAVDALEAAEGGGVAKGDVSSEHLHAHKELTVPKGDVRGEHLHAKACAEANAGDETIVDTARFRL